MIDPLKSIAGQPIAPPAPPAPVGKAGGDNASFKDLLLGSIDQVNAMQQDADKAVENLFTGGDSNPAEVFIAVQKADVAFRMMMQLRNKMVEAYTEVKNIRV